MKSPYCASPALFAVGGFDHVLAFEDEMRRQKSRLAVSFLAVDGLTRLLAARAVCLFRRDWLGRFRLEASSHGFVDASLVRWAEETPPDHGAPPRRFERSLIDKAQPRYGLWLPVKDRRAALVLMRGRKWSEPEIMLGERIARILSTVLGSQQSA